MTRLVFLLLVGCAAPVTRIEPPHECPPPPAADASLPDVPPAPPPEPAVVLQPVTFADIPGWADDDLAAALPPLLRSCERAPQPYCEAARATAPADARAFFETHFTPALVTNNGNPDGRFTGYYEAFIRASRKRGGKYQHPVYARPRELVMAQLKDWHDSPTPRRVAGTVDRDGRLRPFHTRAEIAAGALAGRRLELFWADDPVDVFFAEIQGSAIVELPDGTRTRIGYAATNSHPYTAIGHVLVASGAIAAEAMSMQAIRAWLTANPADAAAVMHQNESFVFFHEEKRAGAVGAQQVVLTPERSLAVDPYFITLGTPLFVVTDVPSEADPTTPVPYRRLMIAQDTGGAIRGPVRGDLFFGAGERAVAVAGYLRSPGRYYALVPR